jgi:hypothetical protein
MPARTPQRRSAPEADKVYVHLKGCPPGADFCPDGDWYIDLTGGSWVPAFLPLSADEACVYASLDVEGADGMDVAYATGSINCPPS